MVLRRDRVERGYRRKRQLVGRVSGGWRDVIERCCQPHRSGQCERGGKDHIMHHGNTKQENAQT